MFIKLTTVHLLRLFFVFAICISTLINPVKVFAETKAYVIDNLLVRAREEPNFSSETLFHIQSGDEVQIINTDGNWSEVIANNNKGWVMSKYLQDKPTAQYLLEVELDNINKIKAKLIDAQKSITFFKNKLSEVEKERDDLSKERFLLTKEIEIIKKISSEPVKVYDENKLLIDKLKQVNSKVKILEKEKVINNEHQKQNWFLIGGGVVLLSIIIGRFFRLPSRKNSNWGQL